MNMRLISALALLAALTGCSKAELQCTTASKDTWQKEQAFTDALIARGYTINKFKVTPGNCYEIYGTDPQKAKVEIYFNPVDGTIVKEEKN